MSQIILRSLKYSKFSIEHFGKLTSPRVVQSATWLTVEFVCRRIVRLPLHHSFPRIHHSRQ